MATGVSSMVAMANGSAKPGTTQTPPGTPPGGTMASRRRPRSRKAAPAARRRRTATAIRPRVAARVYQVRSAAPPLRFGEVTRRAERGRSVIQIRFAIADDVAILLEMIRELAAYERAPHAVLATEEDLRRYGFDHNPRFEALLAFLDNKPAGFALFSLIFRPGAADPCSTSRTSMCESGRADAVSDGV